MEERLVYIGTPFLVRKQLNEVLGQQVVRIAMEWARRLGAQTADCEDVSVAFMHVRFLGEDLFQPAWTGDNEMRLAHMAETYVRGSLYRRRKSGKRTCSMCGADGTESTGPAGRLISRAPDPEEALLRKQIRSYIARALECLTSEQLQLFIFVYELGEKAVDLRAITGRSSEALWKAKSRLRARLRRLLISAGFDEATIAELLNELDRMRCY